MPLSSFGQTWTCGKERQARPQRQLGSSPASQSKSTGFRVNVVVATILGRAEESKPNGTTIFSICQALLQSQQKYNAECINTGFRHLYHLGMVSVRAGYGIYAFSQNEV